MANIIEIKDLVFEYPMADELAIDHISLNIERGTFNYVLGSNGSGKSTLLKCLAGLYPWKSGTVVVNGLNKNADSKNFNENQIFVSEEIILPNFPIKNLIKMYGAIWKSFDPKIVERILKFGDFSLNKSVYSYSKGQSLLIQFALAMGTQSEVVILDEISAPLDAYIRTKVMDELRILNAQKKSTVLLATNVLADMNEDKAQLILINKGKIVQQGDAMSVGQAYGGANTAEEIFRKFMERG